MNSLLSGDENLALKYLETLQEFSLRAHGFTPSMSEAFIDYAVRSAKENLPKAPRNTIEARVFAQHLRETQDNLARKVPTRFEHPLLYSVLLEHTDAIRKSADALGLTMPRQPVLGTLLSNRINGMTIRVPSTRENILVLELGMFGFSIEMSNALALETGAHYSADGGNLSFSFNPHAVKALDEQSEPILRFGNALLSFIHHRPSKDGYSELPYAAEQVSLHLSQSFRLFVVGHEFGHILRGHFTSDDFRKMNLGNITVSEFVPDWAEEFEADFLGFCLLMNVADMAPAFAIAGPTLFFTCYAAMEKALSILHTGHEVERQRTSHPSPLVRLERIREVFGKQLSDDTVEFSRIIQRCIDAMWLKARPRFETLHESGVRPAASWIL